MQKSDFLFEIQTEELPPKSLKTIAENFCELVKTRVEKSGLKFDSIKFFATPRRLAILIHQLDSHQADKMVERKGPALDKAYNADGTPTQACLGFARSCGVEVSELIKLPGNFVGYNQSVKGKTVAELLPQIITESLTALPIAKPMRWGSYTHKFIRPVHSVIMLYGNDVVDAEILGLKTDRLTCGHRFLHTGKITISSPEKYAEELKKGFMIVDFEKRKHDISFEAKKLLNILPAHENLKIDFAEELLDEVTSLVEWPQVLIGQFDKDFLNVPQEALISAMQDHQRYFPIMQNGKLTPYFVIVSNIVSKDPSNIIKGNERVLRARLSDAKFFYDTDKKITLEQRVEKLKNIIFQNKLGSLFDKTLRVQKLAEYIGKNNFDWIPASAGIALVKRAAYLSKADLLTDLVGEFPELQGIAGYYYALNDKESNEVAIALKEQYLPRFSGDKIAESSTGVILSLADRLDTLVGVFGINQAPTGDKDPFGLRRAALGVLRIIIEKGLALDLKELIPFAASNFNSLENKTVIDDTLSFVLERLKPWYQEQNIPSNVIASVMTLNITEPYDIHKRIQAVMNFKNLPEAESLSIANKRVSNILSKYTEEISSSEIHENLFESDAERELAKTLAEQEKSLSQSDDYQIVLSKLSHLRTPVDNFFDQVMVMTDDKAKRENRLLMLKKLRGLFLHVADIALLQ